MANYDRGLVSLFERYQTCVLGCCIVTPHRTKASETTFNLTRTQALKLSTMALYSLFKCCCETFITDIVIVQLSVHEL